MVAKMGDCLDLGQTNPGAPPGHPVASRWTGNLGFLPWASIMAAVVAGTEKSGRLSSMMR